jgi:molecular chaperone Hsp33
VVNRLTKQIQATPPLTALPRSVGTPEDLLDYIFSGIPFDVFEKRLLSFKCSCSKERVVNALVSLGREELISMIEQEEAIEVICEFCREVYALSREELSRLVRDIH